MRDIEDVSLNPVPGPTVGKLNLMRVPALLLMLIASVTLSAILVLTTFLPFLGFAKRQLAERENRIKIDKLGRPIKSETDRRVVISASNRLREMFNEGACEPIYREADGAFRLGPMPQWTVQCFEDDSENGEASKSRR